MTEHQFKVYQRQLKIGLAQESFYDYCQVRLPEKYLDDLPYLKELCDTMQEFYFNDGELLIINMPPRHYKSLTATLYSQWIFGQNPLMRIMTASYSTSFSRKFSRAVRSIFDDHSSQTHISYQEIFPNTKIKKGNKNVDLWQIDGSPEENYLATSPDGKATGLGAELIIVDDLIKNYYEACHAELLDSHYSWFTDTMMSRLEGKRKIIVVGTRWTTKDLSGRLIDKYSVQGRKVKTFTKKAFNNGVMLNPQVLDIKGYNRLKLDVSDEIIQANYNQEPLDLKGKLYGEFATYKKVPDFKHVLSYCDVADTGLDYLCNIIYGLADDGKAYILDVYYTQESMEITEQALASKLNDYLVEQYFIESNSGGRTFARNIERLTRKLGNNKTKFKPFQQKHNKEARILSSASNVTQNIVMPHDWQRAYRAFWLDVTEYQRAGKNKHDDAPDALTGVYENMNRKKGIQTV